MFNKCIEMGRDPSSYRGIGSTLVKLKEYDKYRDMLEVLVSISSDHYEGYKLLGDVYKRLGDKTTALEKYFILMKPGLFNEYRRSLSIAYVS